MAQSNYHLVKVDDTTHPAPQPRHIFSKKKIRFNNVYYETDQLRNDIALLNKNGVRNVRKSIDLFLSYKLRSDKLPSQFHDTFSGSGVHIAFVSKGIKLHYSDDGNLILHKLETVQGSDADKIDRYGRSMRGIV